MGGVECQQKARRVKKEWGEEYTPKSKKHATINTEEIYGMDIMDTYIYIPMIKLFGGKIIVWKSIRHFLKMCGKKWGWFAPQATKGKHIGGKDLRERNDWGEWLFLYIEKLGGNNPSETRDTHFCTDMFSGQ